jgi:hypothetical protein
VTLRLSDEVGKARDEPAKDKTVKRKGRDA